MTTPATVDPTRRVHVLHHREVAAGLPFVERRIVRPIVAAAADLAGNIHPRPRRQIPRVGRMVPRRAVAILTLHSRQLRRRRLADKSGGQSVADGVTRQATGIAILMRLLQGLERLRMPRA